MPLPPFGAAPQKHPVPLNQGGTNADLSSTGGTSQVLQQVTSGAAVTVGQLAASNLSNGTTGSGSVVLATSPSLTTPTLGVATATTVTANNNYLNNNAVSVTSNAGTCSVSYYLNTFTNSSAATMAITIATASAVDGQNMVVRIYDYSAVAQTIGWTNTENSLTAAPLASNGSTTLPLTVGFIFNSQTSKWRCVAVT